MPENKIFVKMIGLVGITTIIASLSPFILLPILSKNLSSVEFGIWNQFIITLTIIPAIASLGLPYTMVRYLASAVDMEEIREEFYTIAFLVFFGSLFVSILFLILSEPLAVMLFEGNTSISMILAVGIFLNGLILLFFDYFRTFQEMKTYSFFTMFQAYLTVVVVGALIGVNYGILGAVLGVLITQIMIFFGMGILIFWKIGFKVPKFQNFKDYLNFGLPTIPSNISFWILDITDRYAIGILLGLSFVGYYSAGYLLGNIISLILAPFYTVLLPLLSKYYAENKIIHVKRFLNYSIKYFLLISIPLFFGLTTLARPILNILSTAEIAQNSYYITPIIALGGLFFGVYGIISQIIVLERKTQITGNIWIISAVLNVLLDVTIGYRYGIIGIAFITLGVYLFAFVLTLHYAFKYIRCTFYFGFLLKSIGASILISFILFLLNPTSPLEIIGSSILCFMIYLGILMASGGVRIEEIHFFVDIFKEMMYSLLKQFKRI